ncbi:MAG: LytTR family DNA-binding domain-containing protein [Eubacterium sp.]|nr:LytTR family DNA-binding domain-containing protein [Eubacterium sp.]
MPEYGVQRTNLNIAICDDILQDAETIRCFVKELMQKSGVRCKFDLFDSGEAMLDRVKTKDARYDLYFVDVLMGGINGIETADAVKAALQDCQIVFVTNSQEFAVEAFSLNALHYLIKPITREQIAEVFKRFSIEAPKPYIMVYDGTDQIKVFLDNILYLESSHDSNAHSNTHIITKSCRITVRKALSEVEKLLGEDFLKLHRGFVVNMAFIERMGTDRCILKNGSEEILSRRARAELREKYKNYLSNRIKNLGEDL